MSELVTASLHDEVIELLRTERFVEATARIEQTGGPQNFFGKSRGAYGEVYTEFVLAQNIEGMKVLWKYGAKETNTQTHARHNPKILECLTNYVTSTSTEVPSFNADTRR